jgi:hypothetical protein
MVPPCMTYQQRVMKRENVCATSKSVRRTSTRMKSFPGVLQEKSWSVSSRVMNAAFETGAGKAACQGCCSVGIFFLFLFCKVGNVMMALREDKSIFIFTSRAAGLTMEARGGVGHPCPIAASSPANHMWAVTHSGEPGWRA